jgi:hypothetical protein
MFLGRRMFAVYGLATADVNSSPTPWASEWLIPMMDLTTLCTTGIVCIALGFGQALHCIYTSTFPGMQVVWWLLWADSLLPSDDSRCTAPFELGIAYETSDRFFNNFRIYLYANWLQFGLDLLSSFHLSDRLTWVHYISYCKYRPHWSGQHSISAFVGPNLISTFV